MYRIIVADDEPIERMLIRKMICRHFADKLEVVEAVNGREAIALYKAKKCSMAVLDIEMPGIDGLEAAEELRAFDRRAGIIFLTAFDEFSYAKRAISVRALDYLLKPCDEEELVTVLWEAIRLLEERTEEGTDGQSKAAEEVLCAEECRERLKMHMVAETISDYIDAHYKEDISLQEVAEAMNYSEVYFCKLFKQYFDKSFVTYMTDYRIERAKELLADVVINIKDIGAKVGYKDANYFAKVFKRVAGMTPSEYRISILKQESAEKR